MSRSKSNTSVGISTILLVFVIISLVSFATLTVVTANSDNSLSKKIETRQTAYYNACNQAENELASLDQFLIAQYENSSSEDMYFLSTESTYTYTLPISEMQSLFIQVEVLYPVSSDGPFYELTNYEVITTGDYEYDEHLSVIQ